MGLLSDGKGVAFKDICQGQYIPALDGLRAVSILTVLLYHFGYSQVPGDLGVSGFFVISGFLITWLLSKEMQASGTISLQSFYLRRMLRIFPAYYVFLAFMYVQENLRGYSWPSGLLSAGILYLVNYFNAFNGHPGTAIAHAWSLAVEEQFYFIWPLLFLYARRKGVGFSIRITAICIAAVVALRSFLYLELSVPNAYVYNAFETRFDSLAVGCLIALVAESPAVKIFSSRAFQWPMLPLLTVTGLLWSRIGGSAAYHYSIGFTVDSVLLGLLMIQLVQLTHTQGWAWLEFPVVRYIGKVSYSLYLYHILAIGLGQRLVMLPRGAQLIVVLCFSIGMASASYWIIEQPFLRLKARIGR